MEHAKPIVTFVALLLLSKGALAQDDREGESRIEEERIFFARLTLRSSLTDNAYKTSFDELEERQDDVSAYFKGDYQNDYLSVLAEYDILYRHFDKKSQEDRRVLEGSADIRLGNEDGFADLLISNDRVGLYNAPDDIPITSNLDERTLWRARPTVRVKFGSTDTLALSGELATVTYRFNTVRDSERESANVSWVHRFSEVSSLAMDAGMLEVEYPNGNLDNFRNQYVYLAYAASLRKLDYVIRLGLNDAEFDDSNESYQEPSYAISIKYQEAVHSFTVDASQDLTDSSIGAGRLPDSSPEQSYDATGLDQIERQSLSAKWDYSGLCSRCTISLNGKYESDQYRRLAEDSAKKLMAIAFDYKLSIRTSVIVRYLYEVNEFETEARSNYVADRIGFEMRYKFSDRFNVAGFYNYEARDVESGGLDFHENQIGISIVLNI